MIERPDDFIPVFAAAAQSTPNMKTLPTNTSTCVPKYLAPIAPATQPTAPRWLTIWV
jgi:hypothetical protein